YKSGNILPTKESIDNNIISAEELLAWADDTLSRKLTNDLFNSVVSAGQSLLMELGYLPPAPKEVPKNLREIAVNKEHLLSNEDVDKIEDVIVWFKKIDHGEITKVSGSEYSEKYQKAKEVVDKIIKVIEKLREAKGIPGPVIDEQILKDKNKEKEEKYVPRGGAA
ncbi:MAG: hypothetical protein RAK22_01820, partial [Nanoarchaeota archaeon]|nr:hypothetical protein [Nanoarchaeota archaeon]